MGNVCSTSDCRKQGLGLHKFGYRDGETPLFLLESVGHFGAVDMCWSALTRRVGTALVTSREMLAHS